MIKFILIFALFNIFLHSGAEGTKLKKVDGCSCYCPMQSKKKSRKVIEKVTSSSSSTQTVRKHRKLTQIQKRRIRKAARQLETRLSKSKAKGQRFLVQCATCVGQVVESLLSCGMDLQCVEANTGECKTCICDVVGLINLSFLDPVCKEETQSPSNSTMSNCGQGQQDDDDDCDANYYE